MAFRLEVDDEDLNVLVMCVHENLILRINEPDALRRRPERMEIVARLGRLEERMRALSDRPLFPER